MTTYNRERALTQSLPHHLPYNPEIPRALLYGSRAECEAALNRLHAYASEARHRMETGPGLPTDPIFLGEAVWILRNEWLRLKPGVIWTRAV